MRAPGKKTLRATLASREGAVSVIAALFAVIMVAALALAVDVARIYLQKRADQAALDLAALAAARSLSTAEQSAREILIANGRSPIQGLKVTFGVYEPNSGQRPGERFRAGVEPANAVRLEMRRASPIVFGKMFLPEGEVEIVTAATAARTRYVSFTIGTRLASLNGGIANALLSRLLGAEVSLNVMDYQALASADVDMPDLLNALAPRVGVTAGSYDDVLATTPTLGDLATAIGQAASPSSAVQAVIGRTGAGLSSRRVAVRQLLSLGPFNGLKLGEKTSVSARVSALDVLFTAAQIANGRRQIDIDLGLQVPGLLGLSAVVVIGERPQSSPWISIGDEGATVSTAQTRIRLAADVRAPAGLANLRLPLAIDVAAGRATLSSARCGRSPKTDAAVTLDVTPTLAEIWVGDPRDLAAWTAFAGAADVGPGLVLSAFPISATAYSHIAATNRRPVSVSFSAAEIDARKVKTVSMTDAAQTTLTSLVGDLSVSVAVAPPVLQIGLPGVLTATLSAALTPLGATLDPPLNALLGVLGIGIGQADVSVRGVRCDGAALTG